MVSSAFVVVSRITQNLLYKIRGKVAHGLWTEPLDFGSNPDHVTLVLGLEYGCGYGESRDIAYTATLRLLPRVCFINTILQDQPLRALLSAILVIFGPKPVGTKTLRK